MGIEVTFLDPTFVVTSEKEQLLDMLISTCEDVVRTNQELRASQAELAAAFRDLGDEPESEKIAAAIRSGSVLRRTQGAWTSI